MEPLTDPLYEAKLIYYSKQFGDQVRTFCMNPYGEVTTESYGDIVTVNGHCYAEEQAPANTNFAVLVSQTLHRAVPRADHVRTLDRPAREPARRGHHRAAPRRPEGGPPFDAPSASPQSVVQPTLPRRRRATCAFVLPYRHLTDILEFLEALDTLVPGRRRRRARCSTASR